MPLNPNYYNNSKFLTVTGSQNATIDTDNQTITVTGSTDLDKAFLGIGASELFNALLDKFEDLRERGTSGTSSTSLKFLGKTLFGSAFGNIAVQVVYNASTGKFSIGDFVVDTLGSTAAVIAVSAFLAPSLPVLAAAGVVGGLFWNSIKVATGLDDDLISLIDGNLGTDVQLLDKDGNVKGGALFDRELSKAEELEAIKGLIDRTMRSDFPSLSLGNDTIRVEANTQVLPLGSTEYEIYDGKLVDAIAEEFNLGKDYLLSLGEENAPNTNEQVYHSSVDPRKSFVIASDENRFFVLLKEVNIADDKGIVEFHPNNIILADIPQAIVEFWNIFKSFHSKGFAD